MHIYFKILIFCAVVAFALGGFDSYWGKHDTIYDNKLNKTRCVDRETGEIIDMDPPCVYITEAGQKAVRQKISSCVKKGRSQDECTEIAYDWLYTKLPKK